MTAGSLSKTDLWEEYYTTLLKAYNAMREAFKQSGFTQDQIAEKLGVDKALVSKRLNTRENLTLKTLSFMASAMGCRLTVMFTPYKDVRSQSAEVHSFPAGGTARAQAALQPQLVAA